MREFKYREKSMKQKVDSLKRTTFIDKSLERLTKKKKKDSNSEVQEWKRGHYYQPYIIRLIKLQVNYIINGYYKQLCANNSESSGETNIS